MRNQCAEQLEQFVPRAIKTTAFIGLDGFVDEIFHVVDKRESAQKYTRLARIIGLGDRISAASGRSTNIELVRQFTKLGGNGPIMANALASFGMQVTYLGNLGYPNVHPVFAEFATRAQVHSVAEPGYTDALEFEDGKIMLGKHDSLKEVNWENIAGRFGMDKFKQNFQNAHLIGFVNWTMLTAMSSIWSSVLAEVCPSVSGPRRKIFFDLADPEKRTRADVLVALDLIAKFQKYFDVILGLNEKEGHEIGEHLGLPTRAEGPEPLLALCQSIRERLELETVVVHPTRYAVACGPDGGFVVEGPFTEKPKITTGAGDHFNSGFCVGKLAGLKTDFCLLTGVATSGFYVRSAVSPGLGEVLNFMRNWPK
jgi:sugar/nucleoside kinase (ribokinase family)